jgi:hypothetical protein
MKIKKFNEIIDNKEILNKFDSSNKDYVSFRKNYTSEIKSIIDDNDGRFVMTHDLATNLILDVTEMIKKLGYKITKE